MIITLYLLTYRTKIIIINDDNIRTPTQCTTTPTSILIVLQSNSTEHNILIMTYGFGHKWFATVRIIIVCVCPAREFCGEFKSNRTYLRP